MLLLMAVSALRTFFTNQEFMMYTTMYAQETTQQNNRE